MSDRTLHPCIHVLSGANGAGKSSIAGEFLRSSGSEYFNPDEQAVRYRARHPEWTSEEANSAAWRQGVRLLEQAIRDRLDFAFETTLGGTTIPSLLESAIESGIEVRIWHIGLATPELHILRVKSRVAHGGHDIPEENIRKRFDSSRAHLIRLMPRLAELHVYDNSEARSPETGQFPPPRLILHMNLGRLISIEDLFRIPGWAKPIAMAAVKISSKRGR